jgi:hypothetical protein
MLVPLAHRGRLLFLAQVQGGVAGEDGDVLDAHVPHLVEQLGVSQCPRRIGSPPAFRIGYVGGEARAPRARAVLHLAADVQHLVAKKSRRMSALLPCLSPAAPKPELLLLSMWT